MVFGKWPFQAVVMVLFVAQIEVRVAFAVRVGVVVLAVRIWVMAANVVQAVVVAVEV